VIDGAPVSADALDAAIGDVRHAIEALRRTGALSVQPTFFEVTTAIAFELFRRAGVDIAVVEVGLGGRLDATNVISPTVTAITSIALDHEQYLGSTIREVAIEKAGIIKPGVPVVVGRMDAEAHEAIAAVARERGSPLVVACDGVEWTADNLRTPARDYGRVQLALRGEHQIANAVVAARILGQLNVPAAAIADGLARVKWPGRLDVRRFADGREAILDAAHNPAGAAALASYLKTLAGDRPPLVFAVMRDKDIDGMLRALAPQISAVVATRASTHRAAEPEALAARVRALAPSLPVIAEASPRAAVDAAWRLSPRIVIAGSIFLLGDVLRDLDRT